MTSSGILIDHRHARIPAILRYRGMESEALMARRLVNVELLIASIQLAFDDFQSTFGKRLDFPDITVERVLRGFGHRAEGDGPDEFALRHLHLIESVLETALSHVRERAETASGQLREQARDGGGREESNDDSTTFGKRDTPRSMNDTRGRWRCASHIRTG